MQGKREGCQVYPHPSIPVSYILRKSKRLSVGSPAPHTTSVQPRHDVVQFVSYVDPLLKLLRDHVVFLFHFSLHMFLELPFSRKCHRSLALEPICSNALTGWYTIQILQTAPGSMRMARDLLSAVGLHFSRLRKSGNTVLLSRIPEGEGAIESRCYSSYKMSRVRSPLPPLQSTQSSFRPSSHSGYLGSAT